MVGAKRTRRQVAAGWTGRFVALEDERVDGKPVPLMVPAWPSNRTSAILPSFLTDPPHYVLGLDEERTSRWIKHNLARLEDATDPYLIAVRT
jgi:CRISPR-associated protein (Cas_Csd1)